MIEDVHVTLHIASVMDQNREERERVCVCVCVRACVRVFFINLTHANFHA